MLNELFTDPNVLKVMFNAENPLLWLQRDFGVFMVNLFDIQKANTLMGEKSKKKKGLGEVLKGSMNGEVSINMRYQRVDWRWVNEE